MLNRTPVMTIKKLLILSLVFASHAALAQTGSGQVRFTNRLGALALTYGLTDSIYMRVADADRNLAPAALDTLSVIISTLKEPLGEKITLTETGINTGVFNGLLRFDPTGSVAQDGLLQVNKGQKLTASYRDPADDFGNVSTITASSFYGLTLVPSGSLPLGVTTTWTLANSPYLLTGDILVPNTSKLVIQPGVEVRFKPVTDDLAGGTDPNRIEIRVEGQVNAQGTAADSIRFISNGDVPASGDWYGLVQNFNGSDNRILLGHSVIQHYVRGITVNGYGNTATDSLVVKNSRFISGGEALYSNSSNSLIIFSRNKLVNCGVYDAGGWSTFHREYTFNNCINTTNTTLYFDLRIVSDNGSKTLNYLIQDNAFENMGVRINTYGYQPLKALIQRNTFNKSVSYGTGISLDYISNYSSYPADSIRYVITDNIIRGEKGTYNSRGIQANIYSGPQSIEISNNTLRSTAGIYLYSEKASKVKILNNTIDSSYGSGIHLDRLSGKIQGNTITNNGWYDSWGVYLTSDFSYPSLDSIINNTISGNGNVHSPTSTTTSPSRGGISINGNTVAVINNNNLVDNNSFDVVNQVTEAVAVQQNAKFNYWGATTTTAIALGGNPKNLDRIHDKYDDNVKGFVNYGGYLNGPSPTGTPTSQSESGQVRFTNRLGALVLTYGLTDSIYMRVADADRNLAPAALDTLSVIISTLKEPLGEKITLTETGINTGVFNGLLRFDPTGSVAQDGLLQVNKGQKLTASYRDPADDFGNVSTITASSFYGLTLVPSGSLPLGVTTTWTLANSPYLLTGDILVPNTSKLVIQPGVEVRFKPVTDDLAGGTDPNRIEIRVEGQVNAQGTAADSIRFISNGDVPASGDWYGLVQNFNGSDNRILLGHSVIQHYVRGITVNGYGNTATDSLVVKNSRFISGGEALYSNSSNSLIIFSRNKLVNCGVYDAGGWSTFHREYTFNNCINTTNTTLYFDLRIVSDNGSKTLNYLIQDNAFENMGVRINTYGYQPLKALIQRNTFNKSVSYGTGISLDYISNYSSYPADSIRYVITDNIIRGEKGTYNSRGIQANIYSGPQSIEISNNTLRSTAGIYLYSEKASKVKILNNTIDSSYGSGIHLDRLSGKIQGNTITNNGWYDSWGVYLTSDFSYPSLDSIINNTISGNGNVHSPTSTTTSPSRGGISINGNTVAVINNNNLVDNNSFDVVNQVTEAVAVQQNAKFNYWGATTTTAIALGGNPKNLDRIHDKYDDNVKGIVNYGQNSASYVVYAGPDLTLCAGSPIVLKGTGSYTYSWNNGVTNGVAFTPTSTATYTLTGTDVNGLTSTDQVMITVVDNPTVSAGSDITECQGSLVTLSGSGASSYTWNNGVRNAVAFATTVTTTYTVTGTDANGCINTDQVLVTVNPLPVVNAGTDVTVCAGTPVTLTGSGASTYTWDNSVSNAVAFTPTATTTYTVTVTDANGCVNTDQVVVNVNALPSVDAGSDIMVCTGTAVILSGTGASTYTWDNSVSNGVTFTPTVTTTYTVTGTDANGCVNTDQVVVTVTSGSLTQPIAAGADLSICAGTPVTLSGSGASTYTWNNAVSNGVAFTPTTTTTYTVTGTDINGCVNSDQVVVTVNPIPVVNAGTDVTVCAGTPVTLSGSGASTYTWNNAVSNAVAFTPTATTTYTVSGTDANGCVNTDQAVVTVNSLPLALLFSSDPDAQICQGEVIYFYSAAAQTYKLFKNSALQATKNGATAVFSLNTINNNDTIKLVTTGSNGCSATSQSIVFTVNPKPSVNAGIDAAVCYGSTTALTATGATTYSWSTGLSNGTAFTPPTTATYTVTGTDANGCVNTDQVVVTVNPLPVVNAGTDVTVCAGTPVTLSGSGASTYTWNNAISNAVAFTPTATTTYTVTGTDANGCVNTDQVVVTVNAMPDTTVIASGPLSFCPGGSVILAAVSGLDYQWSTGDTTQNVTLNQTGTTYAVVTTVNGCSDTTASFSTALFASADTTVTASSLIFCASDSSVITAAAGQSYLWNTGDTTQSITVNQTGSYAVTVTTVNGCVGVSDTVATTVVPDVVLPQILGAVYGWFAAGDTVNLSVLNTLGYTLNWGITGGVITVGQGGDSVSVVWGAANSSAAIWLVVSNGVCQDSVYLNLVISGLGTGEGADAKAIAFPNPNSGVFTLEWSALEATRVIIYNGLGQVVASQPIAQGSTSTVIDLSAKAAGIYRAMIYGIEGTVTLPVYVRH